jgi:hypothetical protein
VLDLDDAAREGHFVAREESLEDEEVISGHADAVLEVLASKLVDEIIEHVETIEHHLHVRPALLEALEVVDECCDVRTLLPLS